VNGRCGAREVVDLIYLEEYRLGNVVAYQLEAWVIQQRKDVLAPAGEKIVEAKHFVAFADEPLAKMRANEPRTPCDQNPHRLIPPKRNRTY
jgi:hypothetical protein